MIYCLLFYCLKIEWFDQRGMDVGGGNGYDILDGNYYMLIVFYMDKFIFDVGKDVFCYMYMLFFMESYG